VDLPRNLLPDEIAKVWAHASVDGVDLLWQLDHTGWVAKVSPEHVQAEIHRKQRVCEQHADTATHSDLFSRSRPDVCAHANSQTRREALNTFSGFDRVLWIDPHLLRTRALHASAV